MSNDVQRIPDQAELDSPSEIIKNKLILTSRDGAMRYLESTTTRQELHVHILSVTSMEVLMLDRAQDVMWICANDISHQDLLSHFPNACTYLDECIAQDDHIALVHCEAGISRSSTIVAAYLIWKYDLTVDEALIAIRIHRACICPNHGFLQQLATWRKQCDSVINI